VIAISLQSGSNGNCIYVESRGARILLDAGLSGRRTELRLEQFGRRIRDVQAVIVSHDHVDHVSCAGVLHRKFGLPVYITPRTLASWRARGTAGRLDAVNSFHAGETLRFGGLSVQTVPTPHDASDGVAFIVCAEGRRLGVLTDLGHVFRGLEEHVASLDGVIIESNYDPHMLERGPYPPTLQERIKGPRGHLSNAEAADLLRRAGGRGLQWACLAHLSEHNNHPSVALRTHEEILGRRYPLHVASRHEPTGIFEV
jgi:phosphoribosyl 1,2-cyclic phosphodiesterase